MRPRILFNNSRFQEKIIFPDVIMKKECNFKNCFIEGCLSFYKTRFAKSLRVMNCIFSEGSTFTLSETLFSNPFKIVERREVTITDDIFKGCLEFNNARFNCKLLMKNLSFFAPFNFKGTEFSDSCTFENFAFVGGNNPKIEHSKEILAEQLIKYNYTVEAANLGLSSSSKKSDIDLTAYQIAYNTGWLNNTFAAYCLSKSTNYLYRKRKADMKMVTQKSLPFKVDGKDIQYPVEALLAFKAKDWARLKELRKKYPIPTE